MKNLFCSFNGYTKLPLMDEDYVLLNDTSTHTVCEYCGKVDSNHSFCVVKEAYEMYASKSLFTLLLIIFFGICWLVVRFKKRNKQ
jgi:hypothetical protein